MESIKPKNAYFDTSGVYDSTMNDTQAEINSDMKFVDALDIRFPFMYLRDVGYGAVQGLCCVGNRYIIVARYRLGSTNAKDLMVFDIVTRKVIKSNIFSKYSSDDNKKVELGHLSSITYVRAEAEDKDYLYIPRKEKENDENGEDDRYGYILRLTIELNQNNENFGNIQLDKTFSYDITAPSNANIPYTPLCLAYTGNDFYFIASTTYNNRCYIYKISANFSQPTLAFMTTFDGLRAGHFARQGMTADGKYLYFSLSGYFNKDTQGSSDAQYGMREMQEIIITDFSGTVVKSLTFPRGEYGEIEDIDLITPPGSTAPSLVIACNQNDTTNKFAPVYACQLYRNSKKSFYLLTPGSEGSLLKDSIQYRVYCDSSPCYVDGSGNVTDYNVLNSNPFATGLVQDKFTSIPAAIGYIKKLGVPVTLYISGKHGGMTYRGLRGINFVFDETVEIGDINIEDSYGISITFEDGATHGTVNTGNSILYGGNITVDDTFSSASENPVQNKVIKTAMDAKADKVANATNGNFAALDANGNLIDSGHKHSDYLSTSDYNPDPKTPSMTKAVGKDANGRFWTEPVESSEVVSATENWLSENIAQETGYVIDDSLSTTGAAADAKATGDEIANIKGALNSSVENLIEYPYYNVDGTASNFTYVSNSDGSITITGTATSSAYNLRYLVDRMVLKAGKYVLSGGTSLHRLRISYKQNESDSFDAYETTTSGYIQFTFATDMIVRISLRRMNSGSIPNGEEVVYPMLVIGDEIQDFVPAKLSRDYLLTKNDNNTLAYRGLATSVLTSSTRTVSEYDASTDQLVDTSVTSYWTDELINTGIYNIRTLESSNIYDLPDVAKGAPSQIIVTALSDRTLQILECGSGIWWRQITTPVNQVFHVWTPLTSNNGENSLPGYWQTYLDTMIPALQLYSDYSGLTGDSFIYFTDYHFRYNAKNSPAIMKTIADKCGISKIFYTGDSINHFTASSKSEVVEELTNAISTLSPIFDFLYGVSGNHEHHRNNQTQYDPGDSIIYAMLAKRHERQFGWVDAYGDYWIDNPLQKIRYFMIACDVNAHIPENAVDGVDGVPGILDQLDAVPSGYTIVMFTHYAFEATSGQVLADTPLTSILEKLDELNTAQNRTVSVAGVFSGHRHRDGSDSTTYSFPVIATMTDAHGRVSDLSEATMTKGTTTEQAFEVVFIDKANRNLYLRRIGAGNNRQFSY